MSIFVIQGKLGNGKTLGAVSKIREYLRAGRRVATNLDLKLEHMLLPTNRTARAVRVPDKPAAGDLLSLGLGCDELDEERYGLLVLDELGSWLNSRDWADKSRAALVDWLIHSRKYRWDVMFIIQDAAMMDKQIRESLMEFLVICKRMDKIPIPVVGSFCRFISLGAWYPRLPKFHLGVVKYSGQNTITTNNAMTVDRWVYRGHDLYAAYDTEQVFTASYAHGVYSYLPPWQQFGRYQPLGKWAQRWADLVAWWRGPIRPREPAPKLRPLLTLPADVRWQAARRLVAVGCL